MNHNLMIAFGERMLKEQGIPFDKVVRVDFSLAGDRGYSEYTPGWSEYPVSVRYVHDGKDLRSAKTYDGLHEIILILEFIDDGIRESWYGR